ncbi:hypothetical protein FGO68_gene14193 [Halteria grandinella]|uniref:Uncharacterized protein n=1 Tax=Halteria grandinella TaxID=5974 RepID=A0A8J8NBT3_HALGN|nr:hypothetical protein FGO68_gene14193 [Halteria grandinella]
MRLSRFIEFVYYYRQTIYSSEPHDRNIHFKGIMCAQYLSLSLCGFIALINTGLNFMSGRPKIFEHS